MELRYIYDVKIGGTSIGLTFSLKEAQEWVRKSMFVGPKTIEPRLYSVN